LELTLQGAQPAVLAASGQVFTGAVHGSSTVSVESTREVVRSRG
jgi:hypothetical protein